MSDSEDLPEHPLFTYHPFTFTKYRVRLEGEGLSGEELQDALERLHDSLSSPERDSDFQESGIDLALANLATKFMSILAARAANGKRLAAALFHHEINAALRDHRELLLRGNETLKNLVEKEPQMPGLVSTHKPLMEDEVGFANQLRQGSRFPFPKGTSQSGRDSSILTAQHDLANCLWGHISSLRRDWLPGRIGEIENLGGRKWRIHPLVKRSLELPGELSEENFEAWYSVAVSVLNDATNNHPQSHPLFTTGRFKAMNTTKRKFKDRLREGLLAKARALDALAGLKSRDGNESPE